MEFNSALKQNHPTTSSLIKTALCDEHGLNYSQISRLIGYHPVYIGSVLRGYNPMSKKFQQRALILLGLLEAEEIHDKISTFPDYEKLMKKAFLMVGGAE